jgi:thiamine-phosphate pyrophosphorylase
VSGAASQLRGLHVLADDGGRRNGPLAVAEAACAAGAAVVQLRAKHATDRQALAWAGAIRARTRERGLLFVVNDRFDLALVAGADGVHLGQEDLPPARIPAPLRARLLIGRSSHTLEQAAAACREPIDYLAFGPIFGTRSKASPYPARGPEMLAQVVALAAPRPVVAIGGIDASRLAPLCAAGAAGVAVISAVGDAEDPAQAVRELLRGLGSGGAA